MENNIPQVDVEKIMRQKLGHKPPFMLVSFFKWFVKQDWYNEALKVIGKYRDVEFMCKTIEYLDIKVDVSGIENLPDVGKPYMFACNHPLGGADVLAVVSVVGPKYAEGLMIPANDMLMALTPIKDMLIPVNKLGAQNRDISAKINNAFKSNTQIMYFPAGKCSRWKKGEIKDDKWAKNFISKSVEYNRDIIPIRIDAKNSWFFYFIAYVRSLLGVKFNIEMMRLPREVFYQRGKHIKVTIGPKLECSMFDKSRSDVEWAQYVRDIVYKL